MIHTHVPFSMPDHSEAFPAPQAMYENELDRFNTVVCQAIENTDDLLPNLAGRLEIGIAANVDSAIPSDKVLRVVLATTRATAAVYSAAATLGC